MAKFWTLGHSSQTYERFSSLLRSFGITAVADVRSSPFSRHFPHFNRDDLKNSLKRDGLSYVFMGKELGGRPADPDLFVNGVANYERMSETTSYKLGLERVIGGASGHRIALVCSEAHPLDCHRCLLVGRSLIEGKHEVDHILPDGSVRSQNQIETDMVVMAGRTEPDFFMSASELVDTAYRERASQVAYSTVIRPRPAALANSR
ncbi:DUF488 family protein [Brevundimonas sp.]|uniref:DUF488 domain-containing protein n=1 Tax=Brevundimonas sp. TaxID=1871086 RepID=UPI003521E514